MFTQFLIQLLGGILMPIEQLNVQTNNDRYQTVKSDIKAIQELIGYYSQTSIHSLAGKSMSGKTTVALTMLYEYSHKTGKGTCLFDTEGGAKEIVEKWDAQLKKRYPKAQTPFVYICRNYKQILKAHGKILVDKISDNGKMSITLKATVEEGIKYLDKTDNKFKKTEAPEFIQFIRKHKIGFVVYDSFTSPFSTEFPPTPENFPARAFVQGAWLIAIINLLIDKEGCIVWLLHHLSKNPIDPYAEEIMTGGKMVQHYSKIILFLSRFDAMGAKTYRKLMLMRYPNKEPKKQITYLNLTNEGYVDATEGKMEEDKKNAQIASRNKKK